MAADRVTIFDTTLRDGEQAPGFSLRTSEKVELARALDALGVDLIEAGFPIASPDDAEGVKQVAASVRRPVIAALARCRPEDIDRAGEALKGAERSRIHTFIATSDLHLAKKLNITREQCLESAVSAVSRRGSTPTTCSFPQRTPPGAIWSSSAGSSMRSSRREPRPSICPTPSATPRRTKFGSSSHHSVAGSELGQRHLQRALSRRPGAGRREHPRGGHGGVRQVECTINGIGERAGNASLEEIVMGFRVRPDRLPFTTGIRTE